MWAGFAHANMWGAMHAMGLHIQRLFTPSNGITATATICIMMMPACVSFVRDTSPAAGCTRLLTVYMKLLNCLYPSGTSTCTVVVYNLNEKEALHLSSL